MGLTKTKQGATSYVPRYRGDVVEPSTHPDRAEHPVHSESACNRLGPVFDLLGKRWTGLIIGTLLEGPARFSELSRKVDGVSERMLTERLNELVGVGLVERNVLPGPPVGVEYRLTLSGRALEPALDELASWAGEHLGATAEDC